MDKRRGCGDSSPWEPTWLVAWISSWAFARLARLASSILNSSAVTATDRGVTVSAGVGPGGKPHLTLTPPGPSLPRPQDYPISARNRKPHLPKVTTEPRVLRTPGVCTQGQGGLGDGWRNIGFLTHPSPNSPPPRGRQHPVQALHSVLATTYASVPPVPCRPKGGLDPALLHPHPHYLPTPFMPSPFPLPIQKTHRPGPHW